MDCWTVEFDIVWEDDDDDDDDVVVDDNAIYERCGLILKLFRSSSRTIECRDSVKAKAGCCSGNTDFLPPLDVPCWQSAWAPTHFPRIIINTPNTVGMKPHCLFDVAASRGM